MNKKICICDRCKAEIKPQNNNRNGIPPRVVRSIRLKIAGVLAINEFIKAIEFMQPKGGDEESMGMYKAELGYLNHLKEVFLGVAKDVAQVTIFMEKTQDEISKMIEEAKLGHRQVVPVELPPALQRALSYLRDTRNQQ